jgi:ribonuclease HIII
MPVSIPTRETAAATVGPRLDISPADLRQYLQQQHGLTTVISSAKAWEPFAWKGSDLSSPMRALWVAEHRGLLIKSNGRATDVLIDDITADTNEYLRAMGKREITIGTTLNALRKASKYVSVAVGCSIIADSKTMSLRFVDQYENAENVQRYYDAVKAKLVKLRCELEHAEQNEYDVSRILASCSSDTGLNLQLAGSAN